mmetsp:Transcript_23294/g.48442  ORF Transcript_23294/g.48442 Transcript_23294/m.48442 type:complete len:258 (-) Transcript_23294:4792-5565(-)
MASGDVSCSPCLFGLDESLFQLNDGLPQGRHLGLLRPELRLELADLLCGAPVLHYLKDPLLGLLELRGQCDHVRLLPLHLLESPAAPALRPLPGALRCPQLELELLDRVVLLRNQEGGLFDLLDQASLKVPIISGSIRDASLASSLHHLDGVPQFSNRVLVLAVDLVGQLLDLLPVSCRSPPRELLILLDLPLVLVDYPVLFGNELLERGDRLVGGLLDLELFPSHHAWRRRCGGALNLLRNAACHAHDLVVLNILR